MSLFESVVVSAAPPDGLAVRLAVTAERRIHRRVEFELIVELEPLGTSGTPLRGLTSNISMGGVVARAERPLPQGQRTFVTLGDPQDGEVMAIAHVVDCQIEPSGLYKIRLEFSSLAGEHHSRLSAWIGNNSRVR